ncbi:four helix bundle protein [Aequorivita echinoideorum]
MNHKEMDVWLKSMDLAEKIYTTSDEFPKEET